MAVSRATTFSSPTVASSTPVRVSAVVVTRDLAVTTPQYLALYNSPVPVPGTTTPDLVMVINAVPQSPLGKQKQKLVLPHGGHRHDTALSYTVTTTFNGATGSTTSKPLAVEVYYEPGN